jgi:DNA-binding NarL/FixJ family response regulator
VCRVLIVDDDADIRMLVRIRMEQDAVEVAGEASSGQDGIDQWRTIRPDVVILDHRMPDMTGAEVARTILGEQPDQAIVIFSAYTDTDELRPDRVVGVRAVIGKSHLRLLQEAVRHCQVA